MHFSKDSGMFSLGDSPPLAFPWLPACVGVSYCGKASPDLLLNQCHDDLRVVINLQVTNIHYLIEGRSSK